MAHAARQRPQSANPSLRSFQPIAGCGQGSLGPQCCATLVYLMCRYEISTEGDSFQVAFHTPADAVGWCLNVQSLLLTAAWPAALEQHAKTATRCAPKVQEKGEQPQQNFLNLHLGHALVSLKLGPAAGAARSGADKPLHNHKGLSLIRDGAAEAVVHGMPAA